MSFIPEISFVVHAGVAIAVIFIFYALALLIVQIKRNYNHPYDSKEAGDHGYKRVAATIISCKAVLTPIPNSCSMWGRAFKWVVRDDKGRTCHFHKFLEDIHCEIPKYKGASVTLVYRKSGFPDSLACWTPHDICSA